MNPYRVSLDKSWGGGFRVGQYARYVGPNKLYKGEIGKVVHVADGMVYLAWVDHQNVGLHDYGCYPQFVERVERDDIKAIKERNQQ